MEVRIAKTIDEFPETLWDGLVGSDPFSRHRFIRCLERSRQPGITMWHLLFHRQGVPLACTSLFSHPFRLDLIAPAWVRRRAERFPALFERFLQTQVLFCGLPISLGKSHFGWSEGVSPSDWQEMVRLLDQTMATIGKEQGIHLMGAKEFDRRSLPLSFHEEAVASGYLRCHSLDTTTLSVEWDSWEAYLGSLRSNYRHQIQRDLARAKAAGMCWRRMTLREVDPQALYHLYYNVFARARHRFEALTPKFFAELAGHYGDHLEILGGWHQGRLVAFALVCEESTRLTFLFTGLDYRLLRPCGLYQNLLIELIRLAIERRKCILELGQTSYPVKMRLGAIHRPLVFYLKDRYGILHQALRVLKGVLFPEGVHARRNVFRQDPRVSGNRAGGHASVPRAGAAHLSGRPELDTAA